ncbi:disulfide bond formation protein B [Roseibium sp. CAU 1637]|uniref:Disulfide bond formation protein B n=1 Tax=Roseibium limicola TaxID=2816037 RepID=A0A939EQE5_9HYPH|nr:disulfide bond formation protein B [Roseibium limicola]MBO0346769.1 disulfide bond formation protein B [Roseibium limicola]
MLRNLKPLHVIALLFVAAMAVIGTAWGFQLIGGYVPCKLCLQQRIPYYVAMPFMAFAFVMQRQGKSMMALSCLVFVGIVFAYGSGLGAYQAGAEWDFWAGPNDCGGGSGPTTNVADMLSGLKSVRIVSCTEASWRLLGLSFAGWNAVASFGLALLALLAGALCVRRKGRS